METLDSTGFKQKVFDYETAKEWKFAGDKPAIVDFYADWCGPCKMQAPVLEEIAKQYAGKIDVYKVDTERSPELASLFRIRSIPSLLFIPKEGSPSLSSGFLPKEALEEAIEELLTSPDAGKHEHGHGGGCCGGH